MQDLIVKHVFWSPKGVTSLDQYDYIVIGSGCTAVAFIDETLRLNPFKQILCLEKGGFLLPCHYQNLPSPISAVYPLEELIDYPWDTTVETRRSELGFCHGLSTFFGGRSLFWSAWCPEPPLEALRGFPQPMLEAAKDTKFWDRSRELLQVSSLADMQDQAFQVLQQQLTDHLALPVKDVPSLVTSRASSLAVRRKAFYGRDASAKFSAAESLLALMGKQKTLSENGKGAELHIGLNCDVESLQINGQGRTTALKTSLGQWPLPSHGNTKVILCAGAIANTMILYNSWSPITQTAGKRLTGHFISHITCRIPKHELEHAPFRRDGAEIAAQCMLGFHPVNKQQFQIQVSAVHSADPERDAEEMAYKSPDIQASAFGAQLRGSEDHVILAVAALGELGEKNPNSWIRYQDDGKVSLQYLPIDSDLEVWSYMEEAALAILTRTLANDSPESIEFWHEDTQSWTSETPTAREMRAAGVVHEASMTFVGAEAEGGSLDEKFRPHGVKDVYVTGNGILPTAGAYNPTLTVCAYAQHLARELASTSGGHDA